MTRFGTIPTLLMSEMPRTAMGLARLRLAGAQTEAVTGRHHDMGLVLGQNTGRDIGLRMKLAGLEQGIATADQARIRADVTQTAFKSLSALASKFLSSLSGARGAEGGQSLLRDAAKAALATMTDQVNVAFDGQYLFSGINSDKAALLDYSGGAPQAAVDSAFLAEFGFAQNDPAVAQISASRMQGFLDGAFADLFDSPSWQANFSQASSTGVLTRLDRNDGIDASSSANSSAVSKLRQAFVSAMALGQGQLPQAAFEAAVDKATSLVTSAMIDIGAEQSRVGIAQQRLSDAKARMELSKTNTGKAIALFEAVDPAEAATRVNLLMTQLETSYAVTGRISRMSLLNYI